MASINTMLQQYYDVWSFEHTYPILECVYVCVVGYPCTAGTTRLEELAYLPTKGHCDCQDSISHARVFLMANSGIRRSFWLFQRQQLRWQDSWAGEGVKGSPRVQSVLSRGSLGSTGRVVASKLMAVCACDFQRNTWNLT